jgi:hypothetical protein
MSCHECLLHSALLLLLSWRGCLRRVPIGHSGNKKVQKAEPFCPLFCFTPNYKNLGFLNSL